MLSENKTLNTMLNTIYVPILNDSVHLHLTLADWESLAFPNVALDAISLLIKSHVAIPENAHTIFFDTRVRTCHKVSKTSHILSSPFDGQKIPITEEKLKALFHDIQKKHPEKKVVWLDECTINNNPEYANYLITEQPGQDAENNIFYSTIEFQQGTCQCYTCQNFTQEYLEHLKNSGVFLALRLSIFHNLFVLRHCAIIRA